MILDLVTQHLPVFLYIIYGDIYQVRIKAVGNERLSVAFPTYMTDARCSMMEFTSLTRVRYNS